MVFTDYSRSRRIVAIVTRVGDGRAVVCYSTGADRNRLCLVETFRRAVKFWEVIKR